ncbi:MAG: Gx transporter family protein [Bacillota bacterium]|nr:Gx transporter family protein [Bacillota bacterium]
MKSKKIAYLSILTAVAIVLNIFENYLPLPFIAPGAKIGLANIITMLGILSIGYKDTFLIMIVRIVLGAIFGGGLSGFIYSLAGGFLSYLSMIIVKESFKKNISAIGISVTGAVFHNVGQVVVAIIVLDNVLIINYLPILVIVGTFSGTFIGYLTINFLEHFNKIAKFSLKD